MSRHGRATAPRHSVILAAWTRRAQEQVSENPSVDGRGRGSEPVFSGNVKADHVHADGPTPMHILAA